MSILRPGTPPTPAPEPDTYLTVHICTASESHPSGLDAEYVHGRTRDEGLWKTWLAVHAAHGLQERP